MATVTFQLGTNDNTRVFNLELVKKETNSVDTLIFNYLPAVTVTVGDEIVLLDQSGTTIFKGLAQKIEDSSLKKVTVYDYGVQLQDITINKIYNSQSPEAIIQDVLTNTSMTYSSTITSGVTIDKYVAKDKRAWDICIEIAELLNAKFRVDENKVFYLEFKGEDTSSEEITSTNSVLQGNWKEDGEQLVNSVIVQGDRQIFEKTESFAGPVTQVTLVEIPIDVNVTVGGTEKAGYVPGASTGDYWVDRENKNINFDASSSTIVVKYTFSVPIKTKRRDKASIDLYGTKETKVEKSYINTRDEARSFASFYLDKFANPLFNSVWSIKDSTKFPNFVVNQTITVTDSIRNITKDLIITKIDYRYPGGLLISVGENVDSLFNYNKEIQQRIKQLEEKDDNSTILNEDELIQENLLMQFDCDITSIIKRTFDSDTWYWSESSTVRNQWKEDGTGPIFRENSGFTDEDLDGLEDERISESGVTRITEGGDLRYTEFISGTIVTDAIATNTFMNLARSNLISNLGTTLTHIGVGDSDTTPIQSNTALGNETYKDALFTTPTKTTNSISFSLFLDTTENNGNDIKETGIFDAASGGNLYNHALTNVISKTNSVEAFIEVKVNINVENSNLV